MELASTTRKIFKSETVKESIQLQMMQSQILVKSANSSKEQSKSW